MASEELKPCPFCGGDNLHVVAGVSWGVKCHGCWSKVQCKDSREDAIRFWNARADTTAPLVDAMRGAVKELEWEIGEEAQEKAIDILNHSLCWKGAKMLRKQIEDIICVDDRWGVEVVQLVLDAFATHLQSEDVQKEAALSIHNRVRSFGEAPPISMSAFEAMKKEPCCTGNGNQYSKAHSYAESSLASVSASLRPFVGGE